MPKASTRVPASRALKATPMEMGSSPQTTSTVSGEAARAEAIVSWTWSISPARSSWSRKRFSSTR